MGGKLVGYNLFVCQVCVPLQLLVVRSRVDGRVLKKDPSSFW